MDFPSNRSLRWNLKLRALTLALIIAPCALAQQTPNAPAPADAPAQQQTIAQQAAAAQQVQPVSAQQIPFHVELPHSRNPFAPYMPSTVPPLNLVNSPRLTNLERDGRLYISLRDAIALALENNLDLMYFRYNLPIAQADLMRTKAGGLANGVNTSIASSTQGGFSASTSNSSAASSGVTAAGAGGLVTSTLGAGSAIIPFDPQLFVQGLVDHTTLEQVNTINYGVPVLKNNTIEFYTGYSQAFSLGTNFSVVAYGERQTTNSVYNILSPQLTTDFDFTINQPLLQGFGLATNERYIHIAKKNIQLTNLAFRAQVIATLTQVENIYWALAGAYQDVQVKERSLAFAKETLSDDQKQLELKNVPAMQVMKDQAAVATSEGDLTVARANLKLNELLIKNALTKTIDPALADMPVIPLDLQGPPDPNAGKPIDQLITEAEQNRPDVAEDQIAMENAQASLRSIRNELLPTLSLYGQYAGAGFGGELNPSCQLPAGECISSFPTGFGGAFQNTFNYSSPEYQVGFKLDVTLRNRIAKADQFRAVLDYRQKEVTFEEQKKFIRFDVRNAQYALQQAEAQVQALDQARDLARRTFDIAKQEQKLGALSAYDTLSDEQALAVAESNLYAAQTKLEQAKVNLDYSTGSTLDRMHVSIDDARSGVVTHMP
ncbi:MAG TPA: TolC family protein [Acidobacteriaceae bacterium]|nr:TolC family protein [Acidobacteriaceae bacterium]